MKISKEEQLEAIFKYQEVSLADKYGFKDTADIPWDISANEVKQYVKHNGFYEGSVHISENSYDGIYFLKKGLYWLVSYKERGSVNYSKKFLSKRNAMKYLLNEYFLNRLGIK